MSHPSWAAALSPKKKTVSHCDLAAVDWPRDDAASSNGSGTRCRVPLPRRLRITTWLHPMGTGHVAGFPPDKDVAVLARLVPRSYHSGPHDGVDDVVSAAFADGLLPLPCPLLSAYRLLRLALSPDRFRHHLGSLCWPTPSLEFTVLQLLTVLSSLASSVIV
jgi:hypothetical protein